MPSKSCVTANYSLVKEESCLQSLSYLDNQGSSIDEGYKVIRDEGSLFKTVVNVCDGEEIKAHAPLILLVDTIACCNQ